jgi:hypothetical protein
VKEKGVRVLMEGERESVREKARKRKIIERERERITLALSLHQMYYYPVHLCGLIYGHKAFVSNSICPPTRV